MEQYSGTSIFQKVAIGPIYYYSKDEQQVKRYKTRDSEGEWARYENARTQAVSELQQLYDKALQEVGEVNAAIFEVHAMMLEDEDYNDSVKNIIFSQQVNAEYAVAATGDNFSKMFAEMEDEYFKARSADIKDISERVVGILSDRRNVGRLGEEPVIVAAKDLAPSETVQMDKTKLLAFVTEFGSSNSHTAILARTMNVPALIGVPVKESWNGKLAAVDGYRGILYVDPDEETLEALRKQQQKDLEKERLLQQIKGKETVTKDGRKIHLYANIGNVSDVATVLENGAEGIGLFRSEFLYLEKETFPTEEEQFQSYKLAAEMMAGKKVIIRTMDIGADKQVGYFHLEPEENPAMGYRAIRICLKQPEIFKTQLRAIFRASAFGKISIMYPMITSVEEVRQAKAMAEQVKKELDAADIPYGEVEQGIMIETPAAAVISDLLGKEVDFFSIGTNDLSQYTMAIDRQNSKLDTFFDPHHPALLRLIQMAIDNGHAQGCWVGICGELGADLSMTETFVEMGIDELSVSAGMVLPIREKIRNM
ncbi:MAG: phosphoenolpyruvate--protein phosphotransferase [Blautia sp.]|jgi:phosphotransferase system enzyme I (PtsI)